MVSNITTRDKMLVTFRLLHQLLANGELGTSIYAQEAQCADIFLTFCLGNVTVIRSKPVSLLPRQSQTVTKLSALQLILYIRA